MASRVFPIAPWKERLRLCQSESVPPEPTVLALKLTRDVLHSLEQIAAAQAAGDASKSSIRLTLNSEKLTAETGNSGTLTVGEEQFIVQSHGSTGESAGRTVSGLSETDASTSQLRACYLNDGSKWTHIGRIVEGLSVRPRAVTSTARNRLRQSVQQSVEQQKSKRSMVLEDEPEPFVPQKRTARTLHVPSAHEPKKKLRRTASPNGSSSGSGSERKSKDPKPKGVRAERNAQLQRLRDLKLIDDQNRVILRAFVIHQMALRPQVPDGLVRKFNAIRENVANAPTKAGKYVVHSGVRGRVTAGMLRDMIFDIVKKVGEYRAPGGWRLKDTCKGEVHPKDYPLYSDQERLLASSRLCGDPQVDVKNSELSEVAKALPPSSDSTKEHRQANNTTPEKRQTPAPSADVAAKPRREVRSNDAKVSPANGNHSLRSHGSPDTGEKQSRSDRERREAALRSSLPRLVALTDGIPKDVIDTYLKNDGENPSLLEGPQTRAQYQNLCEQFKKRHKVYSLFRDKLLQNQQDFDSLQEKWEAETDEHSRSIIEAHLRSLFELRLEDSQQMKRCYRILHVELFDLKKKVNLFVDTYNAERRQRRESRNASA